MQLHAVKVNLLNLHHGLRDRKLPGDMCHLLAVPLRLGDPVLPNLTNRNKHFQREPDTLFVQRHSFLRLNAFLWQCNI